MGLDNNTVTIKGGGGAPRRMEPYRTEHGVIPVLGEGLARCMDTHTLCDVWVGVGYDSKYVYTV